MRQTEDVLESVQEGRVRHMTLNNPPRNQISVGILQRIAELVSECEGDDQVRAILLDSANATPPFAADGQALIEDPSWEGFFAVVREGQRALSRIEFSTKPVVMAIYDGVCMGGGLELALACHVRIAGSGTIFSLPEAAAGGMPGWGNTQRVVHYFGRAKAIELVLTGNQIKATDAHALGAMNHVVPGPEVLTKAREIAEAIARMRTKSIAAIMTAIHVPYRLGLAEGKAVELERSMEIYDPKTFVPAIKALFEGRTVQFDD
jgi:enoyl-CoA hydratase/carnithine racemase